MTAARASLVRRITAALDAAPSRIPVLLGGCGTGRTFLLDQVRVRPGDGAHQYIDVERTATTPERFLQAIVRHAPFPQTRDAGGAAASPRAAFEATLRFLDATRSAGDEPVTFLLDEFLEFRTFESFPGLRNVLHELLQTLAASRNRFVLSTRYVARAHRFLRDASARFEVMHVAPLTASEVADLLRDSPAAAIPGQDLNDLARAVHALADGRPGYVQTIGDEVAAMQARGGGDPVSALAALLAPEGQLAQRCCFCYELRLHRARGYGALKAILDILAEEEPLTLTEISQRLHRTPGSTKDYLSWLEDVDLVTARQKRYSFADPLMRLWVRLHCHPVPPTEDDLAREVRQYALARLPGPEPALAGAAAADHGAKDWGIIEID
ncbi:MAG TPA: helix-turn-helix domain-containing protein [Vicinamibacterales bacterium]|nr:helix-turn-helix domain-containing protein [Vicinamibacterales bacterium]